MFMTHPTAHNDPSFNQFEISCCRLVPVFNVHTNWLLWERNKERAIWKARNFISKIKFIIFQTLHSFSKISSSYSFSFSAFLEEWSHISWIFFSHRIHTFCVLKRKKKSREWIPLQSALVFFFSLC